MITVHDCEGLESWKNNLCKHLNSHPMKLKNNTYIIKDVNGHKIGTMKTKSLQTYEEETNGIK